MTIATKLQLTLDTKAALKSALAAKGATPTDNLSAYGAIIESLSTAGIATPQIIAPMNGAAQVSQQPIITATLYFSADPDDTHAASTWDFASDSGFTNILHTSGRDTVNLESYDLSAAGYSFPGGMVIYARVTYESQSGIEQTSPVSDFQITDMYPGAVIDGDIVFAQKDGYWLLAAPASKRAKMEWGLYGISTSLPGVEGQNTPDPNSGEHNTDVLTSSAYSSAIDDRGNTGALAAEHCRNGLGKPYDLPNKDELYLLYQNKASVDGSDASGGINTLDSLATYAWSSTDYPMNGSVWVCGFHNGSYTGNSQGYEFWALPIRRIPV